LDLETEHLRARASRGRLPKGATTGGVTTTQVGAAPSDAVPLGSPRVVLRFTPSWSSLSPRASGSTIHRVDGRQALLNLGGCSCCGGRRCRGRTWP
jgi:hypothetical protein